MAAHCRTTKTPRYIAGGEIAGGTEKPGLVCAGAKRVVVLRRLVVYPLFFQEIPEVVFAGEIMPNANQIMRRNQGATG